MKRRDFIKRAAPMTTAPLLLNGISVNSVAKPLNISCDNDGSDRVFVVIQLSGGNDGLNTFIPMDQYDEYKKARPNIAIGKNRCIELDSKLPTNQQLGLHPNLTGLKSLYDEGSLNIVQGVSYPMQSKSHFNSTDYWMCGRDGREALNSSNKQGWLGKYLKAEYPNVKGQPTEDMQDPPAIEFGGTSSSLIFHSNDQYTRSMNLSTDFEETLQVVSESDGQFPGVIANDDYGDEMKHIVSTIKSTNSYSTRILDQFNKGKNSSVDYPKSSLASQLKIVARLIQSGSKTKVYYVRDNFYDNHVKQVVGGTPHVGNHASLLQNLSDSITAFQKDLKNLSLHRRVAGATLSEFGRKVVENGNLGTDHGTLNSMIVFGTGIRPGVSGENIDLTELDETGAPKLEKMQFDYREVYTTLLQDWLGADSSIIRKTGFSSFENRKIENLIRNFHTISEGCLHDSISRQGSNNLVNDPSTSIQSSIFPNPAIDYVSIELKNTNSDEALVVVSNKDGTALIEEKTQTVPELNNNFNIDISRLPEGMYFITIKAGDHKANHKLLVSR